MPNKNTIKSDPILRKSAQEVELDNLLAEEFSCDRSFAARFIKKCKLPCPKFKVCEVIVEPSLGGEGFGDLLVYGTAKGQKVAFLIEDKITAGPAVRQFERYALHASRLRRQGWDQVYTVMVAPESYRGERSKYNAYIDLEKVAKILRSPDRRRLKYRRGIIERAIAKKASTGVQILDEALRKLKAEYLSYALQWCTDQNFTLEFPMLRDSYYDGSSWIEPIRSPALPAHLMLRHRLWTSIKAECGRVDLIICPATEFEQSRLKDCRPPFSLLEPYSKHKGVQVSLIVPEMRQKSGFDASVTASALMAMNTLVKWYLETVKTI
jgi:hypothetical protein